jgi:thioredoxin reductase (NADPH)
VHGRRESLTGSPSLVRAVARTDCEAYAVSADARRQLLRESGSFTGLRVIGSRHSRDTFRIREFLARNRVLLTWLDLEADPEVQRLLARFGVSEAETPVVRPRRRRRAGGTGGRGLRRLSSSRTST